MPVRINVDQHGETLDERKRVREAALGEAERLGLGSPPDLDPRLGRLLDLLANHERAVDLRELAGRARTAIAVASGDEGAMAAIEGDQIAIRGINGDHIVAELLRLLPEWPPGRGRTCSIRSDALERAMHTLTGSPDSQEARAILRAARVPGGDIEQLLHTAKASIGSGSFGIYRGEHGNARFIGSVAYTDTPQGRYLILQRADQASDSYTTLIPADLSGIRRRIQEHFGTTKW